MFWYAFKVSMISLLIILLSHHLLEILKKSLTNEKIIDCVKKPQQEYEKIYEILSSLNTSYAKYLFCRPDCLFEKPLDNQILSTKYNICIPNFNHWNGYNDRFAILDTQGLKTYCSRYDHLIVNPQTYHSEKYLKYTIDNSYNTLKLFDNFKFRLLRSNNKLSPIDY